MFTDVDNTTKKLKKIEYKKKLDYSSFFTSFRDFLKTFGEINDLLPKLPAGTM